MKRFLRILLFLYVLICALGYFFQHKIILHPHDIAESKSYRIGTEVEIPLIESLSMNCVHIEKSGKSRKVVLYFHGNKGNAGRAIYQTRSIHDNGVDVFIPDYRGYGKTEGRLWSDKQLYDDAQKAYNYLKTKYAEENIYVMGYSLGSGIASYIAANNNPAHLILIAPFTSLCDIKDQFAPFLPDFLMRFKLSNKKHLEKVNCPISVVHGTDDNVVLYKYSKLLKEQYGDKIKLLTSKGQEPSRDHF